MRTHSLLLLAVLPAAYALGATTARSGAPACDPVPAALDRSGQGMPGPRKEHAYYHRFEGSWDAAGELKMPGGAMVQMNGTLEARMGCNGTWLISDFHGNMMGMPYNGHALQGFDPASKKYIGIWVDMMRSDLDPMVGTLDADGVLVSEGMVPNPLVPGTKVRARSKFRFEGPDRMVYEEYLNIPDDSGEWQKWMTIVHTRKKKGAAGATGGQDEAGGG